MSLSHFRLSAQIVLLLALLLWLATTSVMAKELDDPATLSELADLSRLMPGIITEPTAGHSWVTLLGKILLPILGAVLFISLTLLWVARAKRLNREQAVAEKNLTEGEDDWLAMLNRARIFADIPMRQQQSTELLKKIIHGGSAQHVDEARHLLEKLEREQ